MTRIDRVFAPIYTPIVIQEPMVVRTPPSKAGTSVFIPTIPVDTPSSFMSNGTSSSIDEATTFKVKEVDKK